MNRTWTFTDLEFVVAWEDTKREGFLPRPFVFTSRTPMWNDYLRERRAALDRVQPIIDGSFGAVLETLAQPDIRVEVLAWDGRDSEDPKACVRVLAVRRCDHGVLVKQLPGETVLHSGGFTFSEFEVLSLADTVVGELPEVEAGRRTQVMLVGDAEAEPMDYSYGKSTIFDSFHDSVASRSQHFLAEPASLIGMIRVVQGRSRFGPRGIGEGWLALRDLVDDGRYAITSGVPPIAHPVDSRGLIAMINAEIATIVAVIKDERWVSP
ncbi:hypothetical protein ABIA39_008539 [Nocardia sp. GAS34]|uniref:ESX secretion-associated protein EspG n=1 Tax=unclassified Nocardia TaxID=2637762 RepID=UPI003D1DCADA